MDVCLKFPISCVLDCGKEDIPRGMMEEHVTTQCPKAEHLCPFSCHGCEFKVSLMTWKNKKLFFIRLFKANCGEMALIPPNQNLHCCQSLTSANFFFHQWADIPPVFFMMFKDKEWFNLLPFDGDFGKVAKNLRIERTVNPLSEERRSKCLNHL